MHEYGYRAEVVTCAMVTEINYIDNQQLKAIHKWEIQSKR